MDSGSQITTISEEFYKEMNPKPDLHSVEEFNLKVQGAGGNTIPYSGCILCNIRAPFTRQDVIEVGALIVPTTEYNLEVPVIAGTNTIDAFQIYASRGIKYKYLKCGRKHSFPCKEVMLES